MARQLVSKISEAILNKQLRQHLETNEILPGNQFAYRPNKSTVISLMELDTRVQLARNRGHVAMLVCSDQSAAFNLVQSQLLLIKLKEYGLDTCSLRLVESYLKERKTRVKVAGVLSDEVTLDVGSAEGSIKGPLFFILMICCISWVVREV